MRVIDRLVVSLAAAPGAGSAALVERFWATDGARTPLVVGVGEAQEPGEPGEPVDPGNSGEPGSGTSDSYDVTFLWRDADAAAVLVSINRITSSVQESLLERIPGTDVWHRTYRLGAAWRGGYRMLALDDAGFAEIQAREPRWAMRIVREQGELDPRNPERTYTHGGGSASVGALPDAAPQPWILRAPERAGAGQELRTPTGRRAWLSRPVEDGHGEAIPRPLVVVLDGAAWHRSGYAVATAEALAEAGEIPAPFVLMLDAGEQRMVDYASDGGMSTEIVESVLPWVRGLVQVSADPADIVVTGESLGGLTALRTVFAHPEAVGAALAQSSSLWQDDLTDQVEADADDRVSAGAAPPARVFLTAGRLEARLVGENRRLAERLAQLGRDHRYIEFDGGHDMAWWRGYWGEGLRELLGRR